METTTMGLYRVLGFCFVQYWCRCFTAAHVHVLPESTAAPNRTSMFDDDAAAYVDEADNDYVDDVSGCCHCFYPHIRDHCGRCDCCLGCVDEHDVYSHDCVVDVGGCRHCHYPCIRDHFGHGAIVVLVAVIVVVILVGIIVVVLSMLQEQQDQQEEHLQQEKE